MAISDTSIHLLPSQPGLGDATFTPSLWPVNGHLTASFGERLDPFSGEGEFHRGVDISANYGDQSTSLQTESFPSLILARDTGGL